METRMKNHCATCAFRNGTEANKDDLTQQKVELCIGSGTPFFCHEEGTSHHLCAGFANALDAKVKRGDYKPEDQWRRDVQVGLLALITEAEEFDCTPEEIDAMLRRVLVRCFNEMPIR